jgi:hypothetical protein
MAQAARRRKALSSAKIASILGTALALSAFIHGWVVKP